MNLYLHKQEPNRWHAEARYYLDDFEEGTPREAASAMYFRLATGTLYPDNPSFFATEADAFAAIEGSEYVILNRGSEAQRLLENWWNEDSEMRHAEILCGESLRVCVRLFQVTMEQEGGCAKVAEIEDGDLTQAIRRAVEMACGVEQRRESGK